MRMPQSGEVAFKTARERTWIWADCRSCVVAPSRIYVMGQQLHYTKPEEDDLHCCKEQSGAE
jgi:hypothetical protein